MDKAEANIGMISFTAIPVPIKMDAIRRYSKKAKDAQLTARYRVADLSVKAKGLLTDCCTANDLGAPLPNFLDLYEPEEGRSLLLLRPSMTQNDSSLSVTITKRVVRVDLGPLLTVTKVQTVRGARLVIPVSSITLPDWGSALVLHMGALDWVPVGKG